MLHELIHRSGHVPERCLCVGGHTDDGNVMRAGPRDEDRDLTVEQISNLRSHIATGDYFPPVP